MDHWPRHARSWARLGPPLRPSPEDVAIVAGEVATWANGRAVELLVLGVTPELVELALPAGSTVIAVDRDRAMLDALFRAGPGRRSMLGDWRALPLAEASIDVAAGDGCTTLMGYPDDYRAFAAELERVVRPGGLVVLRLFVAPGAPETLDDVRAALATIHSFDALKWRIAMAVQSPQRTVAVTAIRDAFAAIVPDRDALAARTGWPRATIDHIDNYAGSTAVYSFPTLDEVRGALAPYLSEIACHVPRYELGERCPTLVLRRAIVDA